MSSLEDPRILFSAERTLLAWSRTCLAFIAFGFVVERAALVLEAVEPARAAHGGAGLTFWLGLGFIALGVFAAVLSSRQHLLVLRTLHADEIPHYYSPRWGVFFNVIVAVLGAVLLVVLYQGRTL